MKIYTKFSKAELAFKEFCFRKWKKKSKTCLC